MGWFPLFLELQGRRCLVAGGGRIALQKVKNLLSWGADVMVVSPGVLPELADEPVTVISRPVEPGDIEGAALVVDATGDETVSQMLSAACRERGVPLNVVDKPELCDFIFPAVLRRGRFTAAVSTGGASPVAAVWARDRIGEAVPDCIEDVLDQMADLRVDAKAHIPEQRTRAAFLRRCFYKAMEAGRTLTEDEIERIREETL